MQTMQIERSPFLKLDRQTVIGYLKATQSKDPDVLHTQKAHLSPWRSSRSTWASI
jgi:hypothetical protein